MDALTLGTFLSPILTVTIVWNTGETGDIYYRDIIPHYSKFFQSIAYLIYACKSKVA